MSQDDIHWINHGDVAPVGASGTRLAKFELNQKFNSFEHVCCRVTSWDKSFTLVVVYRPESVQVYMPVFTEFFNLLENISNMSELIVVTSDLNIRLDHLEHPNTIKFNKLLNDFGLCQHITSPTHDDGGILDVIITQIDEKVHDIMVADVGLSDHRLERCALEISPPAPIYETTVGRSWHRFDANAFRSELLASDLCPDINTRGALEPDDLLNLFQSITTKFIDKYAPVKTITRRMCITNVWFNEKTG